MELIAAMKMADVGEEIVITSYSIHYTKLYECCSRRWTNFASEPPPRPIISPRVLVIGLARLIEREVGILARKGFFEPDSALSQPDSLLGRAFGA